MLPTDFSSGVKVSRTSLTGAKADMTSETGDTTDASCSPSSQTVFIDMESLPTGIHSPSAGAMSMPTARTVSKSFSSSSANPLAAIQLADNLTCDSGPILADTRLVKLSASAIRPEATASSTAKGERSPTAIASPRTVLNPAAVTATLLQGICLGPTN